MIVRKRKNAPALVLVFVLAAVPMFAGFSSTEVFLPSIGRITGQGGARFFTTVWATNLTSAPESFTLFFLKAGQANPSPASFSDTLAPGETKVYENVVETKLGLSNALGAARVTSTGEILVAERIFDQEPGTDLGQTEGLFFAGVPASFAISAGQSASIQGVDQGSSEDFRYNFALVETAGASADVNVQVFDGSGVLLGQKAFPLAAFEQIQPNVADVVPGFSSTNARITATVTGGSGHVLLAGAQVANVSQDSSGFEMSFRDDLLGGGGTAGVTSLNGLTGALTIAHGANTTVNVSGHTITIDAVGGGSGSGLTAVAHDNSLIGSGTAGIPLGIAPSGVGNAQLGAGAVTAAKISPGQVVTSVNGLHDAVALAAGSNITLTPAGNTITIASSASGGSGVLSLNGLTGGLAITAGSGISVTPSGSSIQIASTGGGSGGLTSVAHNATLTGDGTAGAPLGIAVPLSLSTSATGAAVTVSSFNGTGVVGNASSSVNTFGLEGTANGTSGISTSSTNAGVLGNSSGTFGVVGLSGTGTGVLAESIGGAG
ncbi:MAG TPA: hypothetical protein VG777_03175, partial [Thermoanaerobaculia bacterium]|nr:hypothetical protein [Thermoanaerobaculia bacterium]